MMQSRIKIRILFILMCIALKIGATAYSDSVKYKLCFLDFNSHKYLRDVSFKIVGSNHHILENIADSCVDVYLAAQTKYQITVSKFGERLAYQNFITTGNANATSSGETLVIYLNKQQEAWDLPVIYFQNNSSEFSDVETAIYAITSITKLMAGNNIIKIKLNGYSGLKEKRKKNIAKKRIIKIQKTLISNGVSKNRILLNPVGFKDRAVIQKDITSYPDIAFALGETLNEQYIKSLSTVQQGIVEKFLSSVRVEIYK